MQQSQHSQALTTQQALLRESQKLQSQQQQNAPQLQPQITPQFLSNPYLHPYGLLYNPAISASVFAQAQLQAMAAAAGPPGHTLMFPWLKTTQQGELESKDMAHLNPQQALYSALYSPKPLEGFPDYSALLRHGLPGGSSPSPVPRAHSPKQEAQSPKEALAKKLSHSSSPSPRHVGPHVASSSHDHAQASPRVDAPHRTLSPRPPPVVDQKALLRDRIREDSWKAKYISNTQRRGGAHKDGVIEERHPNSASKTWSLDPSNINRNPLGMIDPATYLAARGAHFIQDEAVRKNGQIEVDRGESPSPHASAIMKAKGAHVMTPSSSVSWQPSARSVVTVESPPKKTITPTHPESLPLQNWSRAHSLNPVTSLSSSVFNVHSLKYTPGAPPVRPHPSTEQKPVPDKTVVIKTSPAPGTKDGQSVKYISDVLPNRQYTSSPEKLGPMMADGSRARVLSPASLKSLYRFPIPSTKNLAVTNQQKTIINTGNYKVTQVLGGKDSVTGPNSSAPSHLVYAKPAPTTQHDAKLPLNHSDNKNARKRAVEEDVSEIDRKLRVKSPLTAPSEPIGVFPSNPSRKSDLPDVASDPHLRGLMGAGMLPISGSNISWGSSSNIGNEYPGAPTKIALKDALLGVKKENALNLSSTKTPVVCQLPRPSSDPICTSSLNSTEAEAATSLSKKITPTSLEPKTAQHNSKTDRTVTETSAGDAFTPDKESAAPSSAGASTVPGDSDSSKPSITELPKFAPCPKLKKAWIKRSYEAEDMKLPSNPTSDPRPVDPAATSNDEPKTESVEPLKKAKKKQTKDVMKKKRKHKDKDNKKSKKPESNSDSSHELCLSPGSTKQNEDEDSQKCGQSNSKLYLAGKLKDQRDSEDEDDGDGRKKKKKKSAANMPLGENGLPLSVLRCRKEQLRLKKSGESFMQDAACHEIASMHGISIHCNSTGVSSLPKCRECRSAKRKDNTAILCRFYGFRKLTFANGYLQAAGFCDPEDSHITDLSLWLPAPSSGNDDDLSRRPRMELETCRYIMKHIGAKFCELVQEEREAVIEAERTGKVHWKRPVPGVREMCDACETTLFNLHWVCHKCGFGICVDCYRTRQGMSREDMEEYDNDRGNLYRWLKCGKGKHHLPSHLVPTQIIPSSCLFDLCELAHQVRAKWNFTSQCRCKKSSAPSLLAPRPGDPTPLLKSHCNNELLSHNGGKATVQNKTDHKHPAVNRERLKVFDCENSTSPLDWLASIALREQRKTSNGTPSPATSTSAEDKKLVAKLPNQAKANALPVPAAPRSWLCNGQLLQLTDSSSSVNIDTFQLHWFYGMPVMASGASENLNRELWKPETFSAEHGELPTGSALINCRKGAVITNALIRDFWNGFEKIENRLRDERTGEKMILKLKDWPTTDDFIDTMPDKFDDLMRALPLPQYTARDGKFNLAAHLPDFFVRPDLGPKMYIAYGWVTERDWNQGTTNLHLDISDACNLMVYVGVPDDEPPEALATLIDIIREGDADEAQIARARKEKPGALWHIFKADDTDRIRELILKVKAEMGIEVSEDHDPIHDQQIYLDKGLRRRLKEEYGVEGYPLVQCEGDSVFIPAGAPHQVFNLHSCIKVAEDFVSPEHIDNCFKLTDEFRHLSTTHSNHEDKLQLKNIMYHAIKEVVAAFNWYESTMKPHQT